MLSDRINYIVSGLERSGTSLMMQMLEKGGLPIAFDELRPPDEHNPKGYFELAGGKIISQLEKGTFDFNPHRGRIIKITAYGLKLVPQGKYKVIYMLRNIDEVLISMRKMGGVMDMEKDRVLFDKLNRITLALLEKRDDMEYITVNYNDIVEDPVAAAQKVDRFLGGGLDIEKAARAIDLKLYRSKVK